MSNADDATSIEAMLGTLRAEVEAAPAGARQRIAGRLAEAGLMATVAGAALTAAELGRRGFFHSKLFAVLLALPCGVVVGALGHAWLAQPAPALTVPAPRASVALATAAAADLEPPPAVERLAMEVEPSRAASAKQRVTASSPEAVGQAVGLERELLLLEQARTRLSEGQASATLLLLREHRAAYRSSSLEQEREALAVRALVAAGRTAEAQKRAASFVQRFPSSVLRASVERAVSGKLGEPSAAGTIP